MTNHRTDGDAYVSAWTSPIRMLVSEVTSKGIWPDCPPPVQATSQTAVAVT